MFKTSKCLMNLMSEDKEKGILVKIEENMDRAVEEYNDNPIIASAVSSIPVVGSIIHIFVQTRGRQITKQRFLSLCAALKAEIALVDEVKIDRTFLESEEGYDLISKAFRMALETAEDIKMQLYARILVRASILDNASFRHTAKDFLSIVIELSPADLVLAKSFYSTQMDTPADIDHNTQNELNIVKTSGYDGLRSMGNMSRPEYDLSINKLVRAGLIRQVVGSYVGYVGDAHRITHTFRTLMHLLQSLD